jgi:hypothetical protein
MIETRLWRSEDQADLAPLLECFLREQVGGDLLPTARNVELLWQLGLGFAQQLDPCLVAFAEGQLVGYLEWGAPTVGFECALKTLHTFGAYVVPAQRHARVAVALRAEALVRAVELGYERVVGPVGLQNEPGIQHFIHEYGAWPTTVQFEYRLGA